MFSDREVNRQADVLEAVYQSRSMTQWCLGGHMINLTGWKHFANISHEVVQISSLLKAFNEMPENSPFCGG